MIWTPPETPYNIWQYYNILVDAINERIDYFIQYDKGDSRYKTYHAESPIELILGRNELSDRMSHIKSGITHLIRNSLDARQIGSWVDLGNIWYWHTDSDIVVSDILDSMQIPKEIWFFEKPKRATELNDFFYCCYRLLNEVLLFPFIPRVNGGDRDFGIDYTYWEINDRGDIVTYQASSRSGFGADTSACEEYSFSMPDGNWWLKYSRENLFVLSRNKFLQQIKGDLRVLFCWEFEIAKTYDDGRNIIDSGKTDKQNLVIHNNKSDIINYQPVTNLKSEIFNLNFSSPYTNFHAVAKPVFDNQALLTWDNMPELPYKYYNKGE